MKGRCSPVKRGRLGQGRNEYVLCALVGGRRTWESRNLGRKGIIPVSGEREGELPCRQRGASQFLPRFHERINTHTRVEHAERSRNKQPLMHKPSSYLAFMIENDHVSVHAHTTT